MKLILVVLLVCVTFAHFEAAPRPFLGHFIGIILGNKNIASQEPPLNSFPPTGADQAETTSPTDADQAETTTVAPP